MKYRNRFLKYKLNCQASPDGGEGGGGNNGGDQNGNNGEGNSESNLTSFENMWSNNTTDGEEGTATPQPVTVVNQAEPKTPEAVFNDHVAGIDFTAGVNVADVQQAMQNGDGEAFNKGMRAIGENAYRQAMVDLNKIVNQRVDAAKKEMTTATASQTATERAISQLEDALPYTKEPMYKPVAEGVFTQLLQQKGMTVDKAIQKTGEYFQKFAGDVNKNNPQAPGNRPSGGFGAINESTDGDDGQDWMDFLGKSD